MKKETRVLLGLLFVAAFLIQGKVFALQVVNTAEASAEERANAAEESIESLKATEASFATFPEGSVPLDEEVRDEEVVDADA